MFAGNCEKIKTPLKDICSRAACKVGPLVEVVAGDLGLELFPAGRLVRLLLQLELVALSVL